MKTLRLFTILAAVLMLESCAPRYAHHGTAADRTGTNGATNGTGEVPR